MEASVSTRPLASITNFLLLFEFKKIISKKQQNGDDILVNVGLSLFWEGSPCRIFITLKK